MTHADPVPSSDARDRWDGWATFANHVSTALHELRDRPSFSERNAVSRTLWEMGYRPSLEQIKVERGRQCDAEQRRGMSKYEEKEPE